MHVSKTVPSKRRKKKLWINKEALQAIDEKKRGKSIVRVKQNTKSTIYMRKKGTRPLMLIGKLGVTLNVSFWNYVR